jgi:hypothetical protein
MFCDNYPARQCPEENDLQAVTRIEIVQEKREQYLHLVGVGDGGTW